jgi:hypothetical protein
MNPKLPLQIHMKYLCNERDIFTAQSINVLLDLWKEDYELMCEIKVQNKCQICDDNLHWIEKLKCPQKVYAEGFKFKNLYEQLQKVIEIAKSNKDYINLYNTYLPESENKDNFDQWSKLVMNHKSNIDYLRFELLNTDFFITDKNGELQKVKLNLGNEFDFEVFIKPEHFTGIYNLINLIESYQIKT